MASADAGSTGARRVATLVLVSALIFSLHACGASRQAPSPVDPAYPQNASVYLQEGREGERILAASRQEAAARRYLRKHFAPWRNETVMYTAGEVFWGIPHFRDKTLYGPNLRRRDRDWWQGLVRNCDREGYPSLHRRAVTVRNTDMRVMPTSAPAFLDPGKAGHGYPFDMLQNSAVWANTPVLVSHASRDGAWYLAATAYAYGWIPAGDLAFAGERFRRRFRNGSYAACLRDGFSMRDASGLVRFSSRVGMLFPVLASGEDEYRVLAATSDERRAAVTATVQIPAEVAGRFPVAMTGQNAAAVAGAMLGQPYGWGGLYHNRDCSALTRDYFTPFGVWLPRNSSQQAESGRAVPLAGMGRKEKERAINREGRSFLSLLWAPGHVMLYVGSREGCALIMHSMWGIRTWDLLRGEGRCVVGRCVISTLAPGEEMGRENVQAELIDRIEKLVFPEGTGPARCEAEGTGAASP